jgi:hypothetical protein
VLKWPAMRHNVLALAIILILVALTSLPITAAQDGTPAPGTPTPVSPPDSDDAPLVIGIPFSDTFDTNWGWESDGAWQFDAEAAYTGAGWFVDGAYRELISTLEYTPLLDLSGTLSAQLLYRQKGDLPTSDLIAVDLSLDGGTTWFMIDHQIGVETDWEMHIVDLTEYRGQIVRLRFRVNTGTQISEDEIITGDYWIDNLSIQYVLSEIVPLTPEPAEYVSRPTLMGLHLIMGVHDNLVYDFIRQLKAAGYHVGTIKGTNATENILEEIARISPETTIVYRSLFTPWGERDCPDVHNDPIMEAQQWVYSMIPFWSDVPSADYYELMNECLPSPGWLVPFSIEAMRIANEHNICLLLFSYSTGRPEPGEYAQLLPVYEYALQHPCRPGQYHGIALHAYGVEPSRLVSESGIYLGLRHRLYYANILPALPKAIEIPVYLTEAGAGDGRIHGSPFTCEDITRDVIQYTHQLEFDPYIRGFHLWNLGGGNSAGDWTNIQHCLPLIGSALINYYNSQ